MSDDRTLAADSRDTLATEEALLRDATLAALRDEICSGVSAVVGAVPSDVVATVY